MNDKKYFNFPVQLLEGFMVDDKKVLNNICDFAIYENSLKLNHGTELQKIKESSSFYKVDLADNKRSLDNGLMLYDSIPSKSPYVGLSLSIFWDFYNNDKSEFDKICFLAFLGIKSILGNKAFCKTTNNYWLSRMDGKQNQINDNLQLSDHVKKYANDYQTGKIKKALRNDWGLITYSRYCRGFYVSFKQTLEELIYEAEKRRKSAVEKQYKAKEKEALNSVLNRLNSTRP